MAAHERRLAEWRVRLAERPETELEAQPEAEVHDGDS
jgi:hypothetical protein